MDLSQEHKNWLTIIGEIMRLMKPCVQSYTEYIVKRWHQSLVTTTCSTYGSCASPENCRLEKKSKKLCRCCNTWYLALESAHLNSSNSQIIKWRSNCDTSQWPLDAWEVAKFYMSSLGDNKCNVKDAESTDLSCLFNVLEWMGDVSFCGDRRVDRDLVKKFHSKVRNRWAHAPNQEMTSDQLHRAFTLAENLLNDLGHVFVNECVQQSKDNIEWLKNNGITNVAEAEWDNLRSLQSKLAYDVVSLKEDMIDTNSNKKKVEEQEKRLEDLEDCLRHCCAKNEELQNVWKEESQKFQDKTKENIAKISKDLEYLQLEQVKKRSERLFEIESCIPEKLQTFTGRDKEMNEILSLLDKCTGIVPIIGGPGFGKSTIALEVSHRKEEEGVTVIFSDLSNCFTVDEVAQRLCLDFGVDTSSSSEDAMSSLISWLKKVSQKMILVMDNIEQLQQNNENGKLDDLFRSLRKHFKNFLQIIATSTISLALPDLAIQQCSVGVMKLESSITLLKKCCPQKEFQQQHLQEVAKLCGCVPLALRLLAFRLETDDPKDLITWLKDSPLEVLQAPNVHEKVKNTIKKCFELLQDNEKRYLMRLVVFPEIFDLEAASYVIELSLQASSLTLALFVRRSLVQQNGNKYTIHPLIRCFLNDESLLPEDSTFQLAKAKQLMLKYYLRKCEEYTKLYWKKDCSRQARNALKNDLQNIKKVLKLCIEAIREDNSVMIDTLVKSDIYKSLSRFFWYLLAGFLSPTLVRNFLRSCLKIAKAKEDIVLLVNFQCLCAIQESQMFGRKSEKYKERMASAQKTFEENSTKLNNDVKSGFYSCYGLYLLNMSSQYSEAAEYFLKSLRIHNSENRTPMNKIDQIYVLIRLGVTAFKRRGEPNVADFTKFLNEAISLSETCLGCHQWTAACYKRLGNMLYEIQKMEEAANNYRTALQIRENLGLASNSVEALGLLYRLGDSLWKLGENQEASFYLKEAFSLFDAFSPAIQQRFCGKYGDIKKLREEYEHSEHELA